MIKTAPTKYPVLDLIKNRWSARSYTDKMITDDDIHTILEAASWAASANNEQPWVYFIAKNGSDGFKKIVESLLPGNEPWAKKAPILLIALARKTFEKNAKENLWAQHDLGMANSNLLLQARALNIYSHPMAGFNLEKLLTDLEIKQNLLPVCIISLGYLDDAEKLNEPYKSRELSPRIRKPLEEWTVNI